MALITASIAAPNHSAATIFALHTSSLRPILRTAAIQARTPIHHKALHRRIRFTRHTAATATRTTIPTFTATQDRATSATPTQVIRTAAIQAQAIQAQAIQAQAMRQVVAATAEVVAVAAAAIRFRDVLPNGKTSKS